MPRSRIVNPEFFLHEGLGRCSPHARLLFVALWTQADREGRLRWLPLKVHGETFPHESTLDISGLAAELVEAGTFVLYEHEGRIFGQVTGFTKWQNPHRNESMSKLPAPPDDPDFAATFAALGQPKGDQRATKGTPMGRPILVTSYQLPATSSGLLVASSTSSIEDEVSPGRGQGPPPEPTPKGGQQELPSGDPLVDYLVDEWSGLLGSHSTLGKWVETSREAYPGVELLAQARQARAWELGNPSRKKKAVRAFLTRWWGRAQDRGGSSGHSSTPGQSPSRQAVIDKARALGAKI
jgi:hypothetical protein